MKKLLLIVLLTGALWANPSASFDKNVGYSESDLVALKQSCTQAYSKGLNFESASNLDPMFSLADSKKMLLARSSNAFLSANVCLKLYKILKEELK